MVTLEGVTVHERAFNASEGSDPKPISPFASLVAPEVAHLQRSHLERQGSCAKVRVVVDDGTLLMARKYWRPSLPHDHAEPIPGRGPLTRPGAARIRGSILLGR